MSNEFEQQMKLKQRLSNLVGLPEDQTKHCTPTLDQLIRRLENKIISEPNASSVKRAEWWEMLSEVVSIEDQQS